MQDLNDLYFFAKVVESGGFASAGHGRRNRSSVQIGRRARSGPLFRLGSRTGGFRRIANFDRPPLDS